MPVPAELEGKELKGSVWIRRLGKHRGFRWVMTGFNDAGVKLEPEKQSLKGWRTHIGDHKVQSLQWPMFMNLYEPEGNLKMIVVVDKEGFVQSVQKEVNGVAAPKEVEKTEKLRLCLGPWHRRDGQGTMLPESMFDIVKIGRYHGQLSKTCIECRAKKSANERERLARGRDDRVKLVNPPEKAIQKAVVEAVKETVIEEPITVTIEPQITVASSGKYRWKVTIIPVPKPIVVEVEADDFLSAGVAAGEGEVIRVEKI